MNFILPLPYLLGLIESDGSYLVGIAPDRHFSCSIRISSKSNTNTLKVVLTYFQNLGLYVRYQKGEPIIKKGRGRAPCIVFEGNEKMRKWFQKIEECNLPFVHVGVKQRDFFIFRHLLFQKTTISERIALKKSLHKLNQNEPDFEGNQRLTREYLEVAHGLYPGQSYVDGHSILNDIDAQYDEHRRNLLEQMKTETLQVNPDWMAGVLDGDGHFHVAVEKRAYGFYWGTSVQLTMESRAADTLNVLKYIAKSKKRLGPSVLEGQTSNSVVISINDSLELQRVIDFVKRHLVGDLRIAQLQNVERVIDLKVKDLLTNKDQVISLLQDVYYVSSLSTKGRKRAKSLVEMLAWANEKL